MENKYKKSSDYMPRKRTYDYSSNLPDTLFIKIPSNLKEELLQMCTKKELNEMVLTFLRDFVEKNRK